MTGLCVVEEIRTTWWTAEVVEEIQIDVVEGATEAVICGNRDGRDDRRDSGRGRPSRDRNDERPNERYRKARGKRQAMHTTEDLNPFVLDAIKARIETTEVNGRDSRSPLLGCA